MKKARYFVETVPIGTPTLACAMGVKHHAVWIDANTSFGLGEFDVYQLDALGAEATMRILESVADSTPLQEQVKTKATSPTAKSFNGKEATVDTADAALTKHGILATDTLPVAALKIARKFKNRHLEP